MIAAVRAHCTLRLIGEHPIGAAEREPAAPTARTAGVGDEAVLGDLKRQFRFDKFDRIVRQVGGGIRDPLDAVKFGA